MSTRQATVQPAARRYHHGDLANELKRVTLEIVGEKGLGGLTLREAARRVGVSHPASYRHFADKKALLASIAADAFHKLDETMKREAEGLTHPFAHVLGLGNGYVIFALENVAAFQIMFSREIDQASHREAATGPEEAPIATVVTAVAAAQDAGLIREGDPLEHALVLWTLVHGLLTVLLDGGVQLRRLESLPLVDIFYDAAVAAVGAAPFDWRAVPELAKLRTPGS